MLPNQKHRFEDKNWVDLELLKVLTISTTRLPKISQIDAVGIESSGEQIEGGQISPAFVKQAKHIGMVNRFQLHADDFDGARIVVNPVSNFADFFEDFISAKLLVARVSPLHPRTAVFLLNMNSTGIKCSLPCCS